MSNKAKKRKKTKKSTSDGGRTPILGAIITFIGSIYAIGAVFIFTLASVGISIIMMMFMADISLYLVSLTLLIPSFLYFGTLFGSLVALFKVEFVKTLTLIFAIVSLACIVFAVIIVWLNPGLFSAAVLALAMHPIISGSVVLVGGILIKVPV